MNKDTLCKNCYACIYYIHDNKMMEMPLHYENRDYCLLKHDQETVQERMKEHNCFIPSAERIMRIDADFNREWDSMEQALAYYDNKYDIPGKMRSDK